MDEIYVITMSQSGYSNVYFGAAESLESAQRKVQAYYPDVYIDASGVWYTDKSMKTMISIFKDVL